MPPSETDFAQLAIGIKSEQQQYTHRELMLALDESRRKVTDLEADVIKLTKERDSLLIQNDILATQIRSLDFTSSI